MYSFSIRNGAGMARSIEEVMKLCKSAVTDIVVGTITWHPRHGNTGQTTGFNEKQGAYANAMNMPNVGMQAFVKLLPRLVEMAHSHGKKLIVSVAGDEPQQYGQMALACYKAGADFVEFNWGCPNSIESNGAVNPIPSQNPDLADNILQVARPMLKRIDRKIGVKISPLRDMKVLSSLFDIMLESKTVEEISACNTIPGQELINEDGSYALSYRVMGEGPLRHYGGLSGTPLKGVAVDIVHALTSWHKDIRVIALGGIFSGDDALEYLEKGACGFGCAAAYMTFGPKIFGEIASGIAEHL